MGNICSQDEKKEKNYNDSGPVKHREAAANRVSETEMQLADLKSRRNQLRQYNKKIET